MIKLKFMCMLSRLNFEKITQKIYPFIKNGHNIIVYTPNTQRRKKKRINFTIWKIQCVKNRHTFIGYT